MLSDETKWLAVTHKSFDHGRRGFNDRLAFLGRQILELQTTIGLLNAASANGYSIPDDDSYGRVPFSHAATDGVEILNTDSKEFFLRHTALYNVALRYGIPEVVRWQPKDVSDLSGSGIHMICAQAIFAIIGALALEQGGVVANRIARERVLAPAGMGTRIPESTMGKPAAVGP